MFYNLERLVIFSHVIFNKVHHGAFCIFNYILTELICGGYYIKST